MRHPDRAVWLAAAVIALAAAVHGQAASSPARRVTEIVVRGNVEVPDAEVIALAGVAPGDRLDDRLHEEVRARLLGSGRFAAVDLAERYRGLRAGDDVVLVISVVEREPLSRRFQLWPVLEYDEDWGLSFGADLAADDLLGGNDRVSARATWGGIRQLGVGDRCRLGARDVLRLEAGWSRREHPFFERDLDRLELGARLAHRLADRTGSAVDIAPGGLGRGRLDLDLHIGWSDVELGQEDDRIVRYEAEIAWDTRAEMSFPRDALLLRAGWRGLRVAGGATRNRPFAEARGYLGLVGRAVLAAGARWDGADGRLPEHERPFLGGAATLRGYPAGSFIGDQRWIASTELRVPVGGRLGFGQFGFHAFADAGAAWDHGTSLADADVHSGVGLGVFLLATIVEARLEVAHDLEGDVRVHFSTGLRF